LPPPALQHKLGSNSKNIVGIFGGYFFTLNVVCFAQKCWRN